MRLNLEKKDDGFLLKYLDLGGNMEAEEKQPLIS